MTSWIAPHLVLGTMHFGTKTDEATSFALMDRYVDAGGRTLDTANCYAFWANPTGAGGQSEQTIGAWLRANAGIREGLTCDEGGSGTGAGRRLHRVGGPRA